MMKQLFSGLGQQNFFAHPVQKATAHVLLQRLHRVAHRRLREVKFLRGEREASRARERRERAHEWHSLSPYTESLSLSLMLASPPLMLEPPRLRPDVKNEQPPTNLT